MQSLDGRQVLWRLRLALLAILALIAAGLSIPFATPALAATTVTIDGRGTGRALDGVGAVSGGGGNSRLLFDYPEPQRTQVLDYMFRPDYGATVQLRSGKTLWASDNGSDDDNAGAQALARGINRGYIDGKATAYINWPIVAAITPNLPFLTMGVAAAPQPWSGYYSVGKNAWAMAHTTQFTAPSWRYIDSASGYLGGNRANGSYVTLKSTNNTDYSAVIETMDATASQTFTAKVTGGLSTGNVHVWATNLNSNNPSSYLVRGADITPSANGTFSLTLQPGYVYTLTTTSGGGKGTATSPGQRAMALPYADNFDGYAVGKFAKYLMDQQGAFEISACGAGRAGRCVRQMSAQAPINWAFQSTPYALLDDTTWRDYTVRTDVLLEKAGQAELIGRANLQKRSTPAAMDAYYLRVSETGAWSLLRNNANDGNKATLASGTVPTLGTNRWHNIGLSFSGNTIKAVIDGTTVRTITDNTLATGQVGYGTSQGETVQFDNLSITTGSSSGPVTGTT